MKAFDPNQSMTSQKLLMTDNMSQQSNIHLTWKNLDLKITIPNTEKGATTKTKVLHVLRGINGYAKSGECLAVMGGSGAGKSTLLNIISGRFSVEKNMVLTGEVKLNGDDMKWETYKNIVGFVMQKDIFMETLTVREIFEFVINLRDFKLSEKQKSEKIDETIRILKLKRAENNIVGSQTQKGISGGEKRRLNIGFELLSSPKVLFLDEPTSGLDSYTSFIIVKLLREIAREKNMVILYTIHQPSTDIFKLFDKLMILNRGKIAYFGYAEDSLKYYQGLGMNIEMNKNPVDQYLDIAIKGDQNTDQIFFNNFEKNVEPQVLQFINLSNERPLNPKKQQAPFCQQYGILMKRTLMNFFRTPLTLKLKLVQVIIIAVFFNLLYWDLPEIDPLNNASIQNRLGALFFVALNLFVLYFQTAMSTFPVEKDIFCKEYESGLFSLLPYYISKLSIEIPLTALFPSIFVFLVYFSVGFTRTLKSFFGFWLISVLECLVGLMLGIFFGTIVPNLQLAIEISPIIFIPFILFSGFTTNTENILPPMKPIEYVSPMRYTFEFLVRNEFYARNDLKESHPIETLNFTFKQDFIIFLMIGYVCILIVASAFTLRFCSKGVKN